MIEWGSNLHVGVMHQSFVTSPRAGQAIAVEMCQHNRLRGENGSRLTNWLSQQYETFSRDLLDKKSMSRLFPGAGGHGYI